MALPPSSRRLSFRGLRRWQQVLLGLAALLVVFCLLFDWNWLRGPLEHYISKKTEREFRIAHLDVDLGFTPTIKLKDVYFANADWSKSGDPMAKIGSLEFSVSLRDLWDHRLLVPRAAMSEADFVFEKADDERKNWVLQPPSESKEPSKFRIGSISVDRGRLRYADQKERFDIDIGVSTFAPDQKAKVTSADAKADNSKYSTRYEFKGHYHEAAFSGDALTGDVLSFQETGIPFPVKGRLDAGTTRASVEGTIADAANISGIDVQLAIEGKTLASLYPFLLLPLPASPPYAFKGHLVLKGNRYAIDDLDGKIGSTDVSGSGAYVSREPRPLLTANLHSQLLRIADLGPIIGIETKDTQSAAIPAEAAKPKQNETETRESAQAKERETGGDRILPTGTTAPKGDGILPSGKFEGGRLKAIDAEVDYAAKKLQAPTTLPVESMNFKFRLHDAVATLEPLEFGFAGGRIVSKVSIDAREAKALKSALDIDLRNIQVAKLFPDRPRIAEGAGAIGATLRLKGAGNSIADAAAVADGSLAAAIAGGRISNLLDAAAGLNGGKVIALFTGGDKDIAVNCGGLSFGVKDGIGQSQFMTVDTEQTRIDGEGNFSLKDEKFDIRVTPRPKKPGILSLRTPVRLYGSFRHPDFSLEKGPLMARAGAAVALAVANPIAILVPLIEPGGGKETDCAKLLAPVQSAEQQAQAPVTGAKKSALPKTEAPVSGQAQAQAQAQARLPLRAASR